MTSQDPVTSKSHTFQDHHGDVRSSQLRARRDRVPRGRTVSCFLAFFGLMFPGLSLSHCFFLSFFLFWDSEVSLSFSCLTSLFVCARARAFLFCSGWLLDFPAPFSLLSICHPFRKIHKHDECWLQGDFFVTCTVWRNESATLTQLCQNTSVRRLQVCFRGGSAAGSKPTTHRSRDVGGREAGIHAHEWKQQEAPLPHCRFEKSRQASPSLWTDKAKSPCACRFASTSNDHSARWSPTVRLNSKLSKATLTSRTEKIRRQNIRLNSMLLHFKRKVGQQRYGQAKKFEETTKVTCWCCRSMPTHVAAGRTLLDHELCKILQSSWSRSAARGHVRGHATVLHGNNTED